MVAETHHLPKNTPFRHFRPISAAKAASQMSVSVRVGPCKSVWLFSPPIAPVPPAPTYAASAPNQAPSTKHKAHAAQRRRAAASPKNHPVSFLTKKKYKNLAKSLDAIPQKPVSSIVS